MTTGQKIFLHVIDPKALNKEELYGVLDSTTLEWTDGVFTSLLRRILDNVRGEQSATHWIVFDGDVDAVWAENLNSVLDDNKLLTLPNGERLALTPNIRIIFEVENLNYATPATVSRCGMVWFSEEVLSTAAIMVNMLRRLKSEPLQLVNVATSVYQRWRHTQVRCVELLEPLFGIDTNASTSKQLQSQLESVQGCFALQALAWIEENAQPVMEFSRVQSLLSLFSLLETGISKLIEYNEAHSDFPLADKAMDAFLSKHLVWSVLWAFAGCLTLKDRLRFCEEIANILPASVPLPSELAAGGDGKGSSVATALIDFEVRVDSCDWALYDDRVSSVELESHSVVRADIVIDTVDTVRHTDVINSWLVDHRPLILCGPPGSG